MQNVHVERGINMETIFNRKVVTVRKWSEMKDNQKVIHIKKPLNLYSIGVGAFIDPTFLLISGGIVLFAVIESHLGKSGNGDLAEAINRVLSFSIPIGAIGFGIYLLRQMSHMWGF